MLAAKTPRFSRLTPTGGNPMKQILIGAGALALTFATSAARPEPTPSGPASKTVCWVEFASGQAPGSMGAAGAELKVWRTTVSGILVHRPGGDVLIDAGFSAKAEAQMSELAPQKQPIARMILGAYTFRRSAPEALAAAGEPPGRVTTIIPTHAHYDHLAGAEDLPGARILMAPDDIAFLDREQRAPDIVASSDIAAVRPRLQPISFADNPYFGFSRSYDVFRDGSIVLVPLPGHTPGSVGVFLKVGPRLVFAIGDATWIMEAVERGLPRPPTLRAFADDDPDAADRQVKFLAAFHASHPEIAILPAHDRSSWEGIFGKPGCS
jgi:glyoxylase-like metal-dependent hydrolase (beta-lactamase superfamily II)